MLSLIGCAGAPKVITRTETEYRLPPEQWMRPCTQPELQGDRNRDILQLAVEQRAALAACNEDKRSLREWAAEHEQE